MAHKANLRKRDEGLREEAGFTLIEILIVLALICILSAVATSALTSFYVECRLKSVMLELADMIKEAKAGALEGEEHAIGFKPVDGTFSLLSGRGPDDDWNTSDDLVVRSVRLSSKGGGLMFGYGTYGPVKDPDPLVPTNDGVTFDNNTLVCNTRLTHDLHQGIIRGGHGPHDELYGFRLYAASLEW